MTDENLRLLVIIGSSFGIFLILRVLVFPALKRIAKKTNTIIDDLFLEKKFLNRLSFVAVFIFLTEPMFLRICMSFLCVGACSSDKQPDISYKNIGLEIKPG